MIRTFRPAFILVGLLTLLSGVLMPLAFTGLAGLVFPDQAQGSLMKKGGMVIGSVLIGQNFTAAGYFHSRPSATTEPDPKNPTKTIPVPYAADNSAGSNLAPSAKALIERVKNDLPSLGPAPVPADAVTTSGSGLDPDISRAYAERQIARVAAARHLPEKVVRDLVDRFAKTPALGFIGEERVNVLMLNAALDHMPKP